MIEVETLRINTTILGIGCAGVTVAELGERGVSPDLVLAAVVGALAGMVDVDAEAVRSRVLTAGYGQVMEYQEAAAQAFAALDVVAAGGVPAAAGYPMLASSIGIDRDPSTGAPATDVAGVARAVKKAFGEWQALGAAVRSVRLQGKAALAAAPSVEAAIATYNALTWPSAA